MRAAVFALIAVAAFAAPPAKAPRTFRATPGPDVEYLSLVDRYEVTPGGQLVHEREARFRLNTYAAINRFQGESRVAWNPRTDKVEVLRNITVLPNGTRVTAPENAVVVDQPYEVNGNPLWGHLRNTVIVHTALEPGTIVDLGWRVTRPAEGVVTLSEPVTEGFPVKDRRVEVRFPKQMPFSASGFPAKAEEAGATRTLRFQAKDLPPAPFEAGAPSALDAEGVVSITLGAQGKASEELQRRVAVAGPAPARALELCRKATEAESDRERRLLAILGALGDAVTVTALPLSDTNWQLHPLAQVWDAGWASPLEMAALQARVLTELGYTALPALVQTVNRAEDAGAGFARHERAALVVKEGGEFRLIDPRDAKRNLRGPLHVIPAGDGPTFVAAQPWQRQLKATLTVDEKGGVKGELALDTQGSATPHATLVKDPDQLAAMLASGLLPGAKVKGLRVTRLAPNGASFTVSFEATLPAAKAMNLVTLAWSGVPGGVTGELPPLPARDRLSPVLLPGPGQEMLELSLVLPRTWTVATLPLARNVSNACGQATIEASQGPGTVRITRKLQLGTRLAEPKHAAVARALLAAWAAPDSRELLLKATE